MVGRVFKDRKGLKIRLYRKAKKVLFRHGVDVKKKSTYLLSEMKSEKTNIVVRNEVGKNKHDCIVTLV